MIWKISHWSKFQILGAFVNRLSADDKYAVPDCENLRFPIQMELYQKRKFFRQFFVQFMESISIFKNFFEKKIVIANVFPKLQTVKHLVWHLSKKRCFKTSINSQHVKRSQTLKKSAWGHFYHIFSSLWREIISKICPWLKFEIIRLFVNTLTTD